MQNQNQNKFQPPVTLRLEFPTEAELVNNNQFKQRVVAVVSQGKRAVQDKTVQFYINGSPAGSPVPLNSDGRAARDIVNLQPDKVYLFGAVLSGTSSSETEERVMPALPKKKAVIPEVLYVNPIRTKEGISLFIRISSLEGEGVPGAKITVIDNGIVAKPEEESDGDYIYKLSLEGDEEKEVEIVVNGIEKSFRRTFRGKDFSPVQPKPRVLLPVLYDDEQQNGNSGSKKEKFLKFKFLLDIERWSRRR